MTGIRVNDILAITGEEKTVAFDIGSQLLRTLRHDGPRLVARSQQACYTILPDDDISRGRIDQSGVTATHCEEGLLVLGTDAANLCARYPLPLIDAMPEGRVPPLDCVTRQVLSLLVDSVLPMAGLQSTCIVAENFSDEISTKFFEGLVRLRGYAPMFLSPATAGGLIALANNRMTGVAVDLGATRCEIAVIGTSREIKTCTLASGGNALDELFFDEEQHLLPAGGDQCFESLHKARQARETISIDQSRTLRTPLLRPYRALADRISAAIIETFEASIGEFPFRRPTQIALLGGLSRDRHLVQQLRNKLRKRDTAAYFGTDWVAASDEFVTARGLLLAGEIEKRLADNANAAVTTPPQSQLRQAA